MVGRDVAEWGRAGAADASDGRLGFPPVGVGVGAGEGFGGLRPGVVEEGGWGPRVGV